MSLPDTAPTALAERYPTLTLDRAWARYQEVRDRLPSAPRQGVCRPAASLAEVAGDYDGFLFDSFGVLNVGETAIPGAADCLTALRKAGKRFCVLTNAASYVVETALAKYARMGLDVRRSEVISSRDVAMAHLDRGVMWGAICAAEDRLADLPGHGFDLLAPGADWARAGGFLFLSSIRWNGDLQDRLVEALKARPRPVIVGNPDLVAPREEGLSLEPGYWAHDIQDRTGIAPRFFGKPFPEAFRTALNRMGPGRYAMIGDTPQTDILGGLAAGIETILVTRHGILAGRPVAPMLEECGILPDIVMPAIGNCPS